MTSKIHFEPIVMEDFFKTNESPLTPGFAERCLVSKKPEEQKPKNEIDENMLAQIKNEAFNDGYNKAKSEFDNYILQHKQLEIELIKNLAEKLQSSVNACMNYSENNAKLLIKVAIKSAAKVVKNILNEQHRELIGNMVKESLKILQKEPFINITIHPSMCNYLNDLLSQVKQQINYKGEINVISDENLHQINCNIEWQDGIIENDNAEMWEGIESILDLGNHESKIKVSNNEDITNYTK